MNESMLCTKTHEYVLEQDGKYEIGITDYAIEQLGDIVFVELPEVGSEFAKNEAFARISVAAFVAQLDPTVEEISDIKTAVSEAVTNSIIHGYEDSEGEVIVNCKISGETITIEVSDSGKGIENIEEARKPLYTSKPNLERSGMGFTIMESFMDEMKIESIVGLGTKVTMKKTIKKDEVENI